MRKLTERERELLGVQKEPALDPKNYPTPEAFASHLDDLGVPRECPDDAPVVSIESIVIGRLAEVLKNNRRS